MRLYFSLLLGALVAPVFAQAPADTNELMIWNAYGKLQSEPNFQIDINGTETDFGVTRNFSSTLYYTTATNPTTGQVTSAKIELDDYDTSGKNPVLIRRYVGDGSTLWSYNLNTLTYSSTFYSFYGRATPTSYPGTDAPRLLAQLYAAVHGPTSYMVRMMREINPGSTDLASRYNSWAPDDAPWQASLTPPTIDPIIPSRTYAGTTEDTWICYGPFGPYNNPKPGTQPAGFTPSRSVAFNIVDKNNDASNPDFRLTQLYLAEKSRNHFLDMSLVITDPTVTPPTGAFVPYSAATLRSWQPLSAPRPYSG